MPYLFGTVTLRDDTGVTVLLDSEGETKLEGASLKRLALKASPGDRVCLFRTTDAKPGQFDSATLLPKRALVGGAVSAPDQSKSQPSKESGREGKEESKKTQKIVARLISADRDSGSLYLDTERGKATFKAQSLSEGEWERLVPGSTLHFVRDAIGKFRLALASLQPTNRAENNAKPDIEPESHNDEAPDTDGVGRVSVIQAHSALIRAEDGQHFGLPRSRFPASGLREGDKVEFSAIARRFEIVSIRVTDPSPAGIGGRPKEEGERLFDGIAAKSERPAMLELARHFHAEGKLEWCWLTPEQKSRSTPALGRLSFGTLGALGKAIPGFNELYYHQAEALDALRANKHVLVLTPTASGKTLCYNPSVFESLSADPSARALYLFPLNALLDDQYQKLEALVEASNSGADSTSPITVGKLVGGLGSQRLTEIRQNPPRILAANPEMLCWLLQNQKYGGGLSDYLANLRYIVLDEVHSYRGLFGLHVAGLIRRLLIACGRSGNPRPLFVLSSATVGAPESLATRLTSLPIEDFRIIDESSDGSPQQSRHWMMLSPIVESAGTSLHGMHLHQAAIALVDVLTVPTDRKDPLNAILFARSIRDVQFISKVVTAELQSRGRSDLIPKVAKFAAALLQSGEKSEIYDGLRDGRYRAVVSTNALEAGIDIGRLDVCIITGFPFHVMRLRQMAGRAGRKREGAVIYIPHPTAVLDRYYRENPSRLLSQPPETFVIDHENYYIARKHIVQLAATMKDGVSLEELRSFGSHVGTILEEAESLGAIYQYRPNQFIAPSGIANGQPWALGNLRAAEQTPFALCTADDAEREPCRRAGCRVLAERQNGQARCPHLVQKLDRSYVFRDAHPGAIFEDINGNLFEVLGLDEERRIATLRPAAENERRRTFAAETTTVRIIEPRQSRPLPEGSKVAWGKVEVIREYSGYFEHYVTQKRRCPSCGRESERSQTRCPSCKVPTRPYLASSRSVFREYPESYGEKTYRLRLETIAAWLVLQPHLDKKLELVSRCRMLGGTNGVTAFLQKPSAFRSAEDLAERLGATPAEGESLFSYYEQHREAPRRGRSFDSARGAGERVPVYPAFYGQCLLAHLRQSLPEPVALRLFEKVTGYPVSSPAGHICSNCRGSVLLPAAHTLEHLVTRGYPLVALGDQSDLSSATSLLHPQTAGTTVFLYDSYDGGIGASEKVFDLFSTLLERGLESLACDCGSDTGCPLCLQITGCDRDNESLSKASAKALIQLLLGREPKVAFEPLRLRREEYNEQARESAKAQEKGRSRSQGELFGQNGANHAQSDPCAVLRVQPHVHTDVLRRAIEIRGEEIVSESPPVTVSDLRAAYESIYRSKRPTEWSFPASWGPSEVLHIQPDASEKLARAAYKTIVRAVHPDLNAEQVGWATEATTRVNAAWEDWRQNQRKS